MSKGDESNRVTGLWQGLKEEFQVKAQGMRSGQASDAASRGGDPSKDTNWLSPFHPHQDNSGTECAFGTYPHTKTA